MIKGGLSTHVPEEPSHSSGFSVVGQSVLQWG